MDSNKIYPRTDDKQTVYLKSVISRPTIEVGDFKSIIREILCYIMEQANNIIDIRYEQTGAATAVNELGMHKMQGLERMHK